MRIAEKFISRIFLFYFLFIIIFFSVFSWSCKKNELADNSLKIEFAKEQGLISTDTSLPMGSMMRFKIKASGLEAPITNLVVLYNNGLQQYYLDTGLYSKDFIYSLEIIKGPSINEEWSFFVMNKYRQTASIDVNVSIAPGGVFGNITSFEVILGAQNNTQLGHFYSVLNDTVYSLEEAYNNQLATDIAYYYHGVYEATISSPNDNDAPLIFTGPYGISNWQYRNESRYNLTSLTINDFDNAINDSLLIANYNVTGAKRKGKNLIPGQIWAFRIQSGKIGLLKVNDITPSSMGKIELSIKIQE